MEDVLFLSEGKWNVPFQISFWDLRLFSSSFLFVFSRFYLNNRANTVVSFYFSCLSYAPWWYTFSRSIYWCAIFSDGDWNREQLSNGTYSIFPIFVWKLYLSMWQKNLPSFLLQTERALSQPYYRDSTATKPLPLQTKYRTQSDKIASTALELIRTQPRP